MDRILLAWVFGALFGIVPAIAVVLLGILIGGLNFSISLKNKLLLGLVLLGYSLALIWAEVEMHISHELGCYFLGILIGYGIPIMVLYTKFKPFKSGVKGRLEFK